MLKRILGLEDETVTEAGVAPLQGCRETSPVLHLLHYFLRKVTTILVFIWGN